MEYVYDTAILYKRQFYCFPQNRVQLHGMNNVLKQQGSVEHNETVFVVRTPGYNRSSLLLLLGMYGAG